MFWQEILPAEAATQPPFADRYPARLPDGRILFLPIRALGDSGQGISSLILNQTAFAVEDALADLLADHLRPLDLEVIVGLPTLGLSLARATAERLGHSRYVALGTSRKFWYDETLSVPMTSITSPGKDKRLYLDPRMVPLLQGRRIGVIDDVISTGSSMAAGLGLLERAGFYPQAVGAAMLQTLRWVERLAVATAQPPDRVVGVLHTPLLERGGDGWFPGASS
jgi:adenine/guanine phosphoribosyltransferase-like PRPP-binding protein